MKSYILPLILFFVTNSAIVTAQITVNKNTGCAPLTGVEFSSPVPGNWNFGNGTSAPDTDNGSAIYSTPGEYTVTFNDGTTEYTETITVYGNPSPDFSVNGSASGCPPFTVSFIDESSAEGSSNIIDWQWAFGNGASSTDQNPDYTYTITGSYNISLIVTDNNGCDTTVVKTSFINVSNPPDAGFTATPLSSCTAPLVVNITNTSTNSEGGTTDLTYEWDYGDSQTSSSANPGSHSYNAVGNYPIKLIVSENGGCSDELTRNINIGSPEAIINVADTICIGENVQYLNNSNGGTSYEWTFDDGGSSTLQNPFHVFSSGGFHKVTLTAKDLGCQDETEKEVFVQEPQVTLTGTPSYQCEEPFCVQFTATGDGITEWEYVFFGGQTSSEQNPEHCYNHIGGDEYTVYYYDGYNYNTTVTGTTPYGCSASASFRDTIFPLSANFAPNITQGCAPLTVTFQDSSASGSPIVSYEYDFDDGSTGTSDSVTHTFTTPGEYDVTLTIENENGCKNTSFPIKILVGNTIDVNLSVSPSVVCIGDTVTITDATGDSRIDDYHFSTDENRGSESCPNDSIQQWSYFNETGQHDITFYANYNGCISEKLFENAVTVNGPSSSFKWFGNCANPNDINFEATVSDVDSLYWYFGDNDTLATDDLTDTNTTHSYIASGDYTVSLISTNGSSGCSNDTNTMVVNVRMLEAAIKVDSLICASTTFKVSGVNSVDVDGNCNNAYRWDYGDGSPMFLSNDSIWNTSRIDTGAHTIRLMVYDVNGCRDTAETEIIVTDLYAGFSVDKTTGCIPLTINFTDTSWSATKLETWDWSFGDGNIDNVSTTSNTYTSLNTPNYEVVLNVTDSLGCTDQTRLTISPIIPDSNFTVNDRTICVGDEVTFTLNNQNSMSSAVWDFGGQGSSVELNPAFTFDTSGDFPITVQLTDTNGCNTQNTLADYMFVDAYPIAGFRTNVDTLNEVCINTSIGFKDTSSFDLPPSGVTEFSKRTWDLGIGSNILPDDSVTWNFDEKGDYEVKLTVESTNGCSNTINKNIKIVGPVADFTVSKPIICIDEEITFNIDTDSSDIFAYSWAFGDGAVSDTTYISEISSAEVSHQYTFVPDGGSLGVTLVVWSDAFECANNANRSISLHNIEANFGFEDSTVCLDNKVVFGDSSEFNLTTNWFWDLGNGVTRNVSSPPNPQTYESTGTGTYDVLLRLEDPVSGCVDSMIKQLEILSLPSVSAIGDVICNGDTALLVASGAETYTWHDTITIFNVNADFDSAYANPEISTSYTITGTDTNNCNSEVTTDIHVIQEKNALIVDKCIIIGDSITLGVDYGAGYTYDWSNGETDFLKCMTCPEQTIQITEEVETIVYEVTYSDTLGCFTKTDKYNICVEDKYTVDVPSAFTPDGFGENDIVKVKGHGIKELIYFRIYNRWGELVFETNEISKGWDGVYKGNAQGVETFVYQAKVKFYNDQFGEKGGDITLIR